MNTTMDAYEAARLAYLALNPGSADHDWREWLKQTEQASNSGTGDIKALAKLCRDCISSDGIDEDPSLLRQVSHAAGYFQATFDVVEEFAHDETIQLVG